jgi:hypothetical protein
MKKLIIIPKIFSSFVMLILLTSCTLASLGFSLLFYTNNDILFENGNLDLSNVNITTIILILMVMAVEGSKITISLSKVFFKGKQRIANILLILLFFASIIASMSFFLIGNPDYSPGTKIINSLSEYIPMFCFKKHMILLTNVSISIFIELLILLLPEFIISVFITRENILQNKNVIKRIGNILLHYIDNKITCIENKVGLNQGKNHVISNEKDVIKVLPEDTKKPSIPLTIGCNKRNEDVTNEKKDVIKEKIVPVEKSNEVNTDSLQLLIEKIDEYITLHYNVDELVNVTKLKEVFGFKKNDRKWNDKIRPFLKSVKIINGRLRRIKVKTNNNLQRVK